MFHSASGQHSGPIFKSHEIQEESLNTIKEGDGAQQTRGKHFPLMLFVMSNCSLHNGTELFKADYICIPQVKWE